MKLKRIIAGIMAFVFSLNMIHINVKAEEFSKENSNEEKVVIIKAEDENTTEEASESGILTKILMLFGKGVVSVVKIAGYGVFYVIKITGGLVFSLVKEIFMRTLTSVIIVGLVVGFAYYKLKDSELVKKIIGNKTANSDETKDLEKTGSVQIQYNISV